MIAISRARRALLAKRLRFISGVLVIAAGLALPACSNHHVSPFPQGDPAELLRPIRDLEGQLARIKRESGSLGLEEIARLPGKLANGRPFVIVGLAGVDPVGRRITAVRVATEASIVLALGPASFPVSDSAAPTELVEALFDGGGFPSGVDWTGDGAPDLAVRASDGSLGIFGVDSLGATRYPVLLAWPPTRVMDANGDGRPDLAGTAPIPAGDPIAPELVDVAICDRVAFRNDNDDARAFHRRERSREKPPPGSPPARAIRHAVERAFHGIRAGEPRDAEVQAASDAVASLAPLPDALVASWVRWRGFLVDQVR